MLDSDDPRPVQCVRQALDRHPISEASLVLTAVAIDNRIDRVDGLWCLMVPEPSANQAVRELEKYTAENIPIVAPPTKPITFDSGWLGVLGYLLIIWLLPVLELTVDNDWRGAGRMEAGLVMAGEWWRTATALTLHGDLGHLLGNSVFGTIFGLFVGRYLGSGFGWLLVLLAAMLGNTLNAWIQPDDFRSIGASTATFAALGLVSGFVWRRGFYRHPDWRRAFAPIFAAFALLAYTGFGGENTDVMAHITGFGSGLATGLLIAGFDIRRLGKSGHYIAAAITLGILWRAWYVALNAAHVSTVIG